MAYLVTVVTPISPLNAFLATTPGGINAVLAEASSVADSNIALISTVQTMRLFAMVLIAPPLLRFLVRRTAARQQRAPQELIRQALARQEIARQGLRLRASGRSTSNGATPKTANPVSAGAEGPFGKWQRPAPSPQPLKAASRYKSSNHYQGRLPKLAEQ